MRVVIIGGNERMMAQYESICKEHGCRAKVFTKENGSLKKKLGYPDLLILFISTVSHKMVLSVTQEAKKTVFQLQGCTRAALLRFVQL